MLHYKNLQLYLRLRLKVKKNTSRPRIQSIATATTISWIQHTKKNRSRKNGNKYRKVLYELMNNVVYGKTMENLRNKIDVKLACNKKDYLEETLKARYMSHKIFENNLVAICKNEVSI